MFVRLFGSFVWIGSPVAKDYKGLVMKANPDLHPELSAQVRSVLPPGASILDFGAGQGALSMRLQDEGYSVFAADKDIENFRASSVPFVQIDFNDSASVERFVVENTDRFDAVIGMEVIEHVENPWEYIRLLRTLVKPGGHIFVTTPNVESWVSRWNFLMRGRLAHFEDGDYIASGHINPVSSWELSLILRELGFIDVQTRDICSLPLIWITRNLRLMLGSLLLAPLRWALSGRTEGDITLCFARRPESAQGASA